MRHYFKSFNVFSLIIYIFSLITNAAQLVDDVDFFYGNGTGATVAETVAQYVHKGRALDHFTKRRIKAVQDLYQQEQLQANPNLNGNFAPLGSVNKILKSDHKLLSMNPRYASGSGEKIKFFTRSGLDKSQVFLINGKFYYYHANGHLELYNSDGSILDGVTGDIIVMDQQGNIFIYSKEMGFIHHSSFFSQKPIAFGAMVRIQNGELVRLDGTKEDLCDIDLFPTRVRGENYHRGLMYYSGHYDPHSGSDDADRESKQEALDIFKQELEMIHFFVGQTDMTKFNSYLNSRLVTLTDLVDDRWEIVGGCYDDELWNKLHGQKYAIEVTLSFVNHNASYCDSGEVDDLNQDPSINIRTLIAYMFKQNKGWLGYSRGLVFSEGMILELKDMLAVL